MYEINMISVLDISLVNCYGTVKTKEESFFISKTDRKFYLCLNAR